MHDFKLVVNTGMLGTNSNIYCGPHEFVDMTFVLHFLRVRDGFADIGANVGNYTILASKVIGARSRAYEPHPETFEKLRLNLTINILETVTPSIISLLKDNGLERVAYDSWERRFVDDGPIVHNTLWIRDRADCTARVESSPKFEVFGERF